MNLGEMELINSSFRLDEPTLEPVMEAVKLMAARNDMSPMFQTFANGMLGGASKHAMLVELHKIRMTWHGCSVACNDDSEFWLIFEGVISE